MALSANIYLESGCLAQLKTCSNPCPQRRLRYNKEETEKMHKCKCGCINHGIIRTKHSE